MRTLLRAPGFAIAAALTLALGIGATTALFSVVHAALLEPLPFGDPAHTAVVWSGSFENAGSWMSYDEYELLTYEPHVFDAVGVYDMDTKSVTGAGDPERVHAAQMSQKTLGVLGVAPMLGRDFLPQEDVPGANDVALIGYSFWQRHFGGDPIGGRQAHRGRGQAEGRDRRDAGELPHAARLRRERARRSSSRHSRQRTASTGRFPVRPSHPAEEVTDCMRSRISRPA